MTQNERCINYSGPYLFTFCNRGVVGDSLGLDIANLNRESFVDNKDVLSNCQDTF